MSTTLKEQIEALEIAIADPKNAKIKPDLEAKLDELKAQLPAEVTEPKKKTTKAKETTPAPTGVPVVITAENPYKQKIDQATTALNSRATDASMKPELEKAIQMLTAKAEDWEKRQEKKRNFKTSEQLQTEKKDKTEIKAPKSPKATKPGIKPTTVVKKTDEVVEVIDTVEIDGKTYLVDNCIGAYIQWYNQRHFK